MARFDPGRIAAPAGWEALEAEGGAPAAVESGSGIVPDGTD